MSLSPGARTWQRFRSNRSGMAGLLFIIVATLISILGYLITPDHSPYANDQKPELHILPPGSRAQFLLVQRNGEQQETGLLDKMLKGSLDNTLSYSAHSYTFSEGSIQIEEFTGNTPNAGQVSAFNLADVLYPLEPAYVPVYNAEKQTLSFQRLGQKETETKSIRELQENLLRSHLIQRRYVLGTDLLGRDLLSRLFIGTRISLSVGFISVLISIFIGIVLGSISGYFRGRVDVLISWFFNVVWSIPTILLVIAISLVLGKGIVQVFIAVGLTMWVDVARVVRGQVLSIREKDFVEAGRALGYSNARIIFKHVLPNVMGPVIVMAASNFASAILMEAGLSFLGLGAQPPLPSCGEMINAHRGYILMDKAYLAFIPGLAIMSLVLSFMLVGNGLRDALDTRLAVGPASA